MSEVNKDLVARHFGRSAATYESVTPLQDRMADRLAEHAAGIMRDRPVRRILEIGCGTGRLTRKLVERFPSAGITAIDISGEMVREAARRCSRAVFEAADGEEFVRASRTGWDLIVSNATVQWFDEPGRTLTLCRGRLSDEGYLAFSTFGDETFRELRRAFALAYAEQLLPERLHIMALRGAGFWRDVFPDADIREELVVSSFPGVRDFLRTVQRAGATHAAAGGQYLSRGILRGMTRHYEEQFPASGSKGIRATYHVIYVTCAARPFAETDRAGGGERERMWPC